MDRQEAGRRGIRAAIEKDAEHQSKAGRAGFAATVNRHWAGDKDAYLSHQRKRANQAVLDALVEIDQRAKLDAGAEIVCHELPVFVEPDEDMSWQETVKRGPRGRSRAG